ncbi:hotdog fold thioesterase [Schleiferiaceae bacterium]|nr:hotdog fold thioesterase [Schleiferiaceae bacterium]
MDQAKEIVGHMMKNDAFSQWLGITVVSNAPGEATLKMTVRDEMTNGFHIAHGGITYSLADSALAFASNGSGRQSLSIETSIHHLHAVRAGEELTAFATLLSETHKTGLYQIDITTTSGQRIAWFKGTVYRTSKEWNL